jgi:hypothetical protein
VAELSLPAPQAGPRNIWLVSARWDVAVFGGSALLSLLLLAWGRAHGLDATPTWTWIIGVVFVDVAHVWSTVWRVYMDPEERARRPGLYLGIPLGAYAAGVLLHSGGSLLFWRVLAYAAVFHFVRQQYGWVALYRRKLGVASRLDRVLDDAAIYSATLYPLLHWHAHLPREFEWFVKGDFLPGVPVGAAQALLPVHLTISAAWLLRQLQLLVTGRPLSPGKCLVVVSTWLCWWLGIVAFDSDYAFTVTNVLIHGVPYLGFVWFYGRNRYREGAFARVFQPRFWPLYLLPLALVAFVEEWGWDRLVWHDHPGLFAGPELFPSRLLLSLLVPLLALPQATHYLLDAWVWKVGRGRNPGLAQNLGF